MRSYQWLCGNPAQNGINQTGKATPGSLKLGQINGPADCGMGWGQAFNQLCSTDS
jgi:hypothetical protein